MAQTPEIEALQKRIRTMPGDTAKVNALNQLNKMLWQAGSLTECIENGNLTLELAKSLGYKQGVAGAYGNIGVAYRNKGDYSRALEYYFDALRIDEELNDSSGMAKRLNNIGLVYNNLHEQDKSLQYYLRALEIDQKLGNKRGEAIRLGNIGSVYFDHKNFEKAMEYYYRSLKIDEQLDDKRGQAKDWGSIGTVYASIGDSANAKGNKELAFKVYYKKAEEHFRKSVQIYSKLNDKQGVSIFKGNIGQLCSLQGKYAEAEQNIKEALQAAYDIGDLYIIKDQEDFLTQLYDKTGRSKEALLHYKKFITARDSIFNEDNTKKQVRAEMNYQFEKKEAAAKLEQEKKDAVAAAEKKRQQIILAAVSAFGLLVLGFALFAYRSFLQKKRANLEISRQKALIEEKQREILDSIYYARRIQRSLLPNERAIVRMLKR